MLRKKTAKDMMRMYSDIELRLEVISEVIDELLESYPEERRCTTVEERIQHKLMLRKLAGENNGNIFDQY